MPPMQSPHGTELIIDPGGLAARLVVHAEADAASLSAESLVELIRAHNVMIAEDLPARVGAFLMKCRQSRQRRELVVAQARLAQHGEDARIEWAPNCDPEAPPELPAEHGDGARVDYYSQSKYVAIDPGAVLGVVRPPTLGLDGFDVTGRALKAKPGAELPLRFDEDTIALDDAGTLTAIKGGVIQLHHDLVRIMPLFEVRGAVDFSVGNVHFAGCVSVGGDVCDRFVVSATEDLAVQGLIGAATILCGRNFRAALGMAAQERGCLMVSGETRAGYLKNVHGVIGGNLVALREILNCDLALQGSLLAESAGVMGGAILIGRTAVIGTLGSPGGVPTLINFGIAASRERSIQQHLSAMHAVMARPPRSGPDARLTPSEIIARRIREIVGPGQVNQSMPRKVDLTITRMLHAGAIIRTGRTRVAVNCTMPGPIRIHGEQHTGLFFQVAGGASRPLVELSQPIQKAG